MRHAILVAGALVVLAAGSSIIGLLIPAYGDACWYSFSDIISQNQKYPFLDSGRGAMAYFFSFFSDYHLNCDKGFIPLIADFPGYYRAGAPDSLVYLNRPLYPAIASLLFIVIRPVTGLPDFIAAFASAIILNFIVGGAAAILFYFLLKRFFSTSVSFASAALFIFSPFFHIFITQPIAEILSAFIVVCALFLLAQYAERTSSAKLVLFSFIFGVLMLGKMIYALAFFIIFLVWYFHRWKEGVLFLVLQSIPVAVWFLLVRYYLDVPYYIHELQYGNATAAWLFTLFTHPWQETAFIIINSAPHFFTATVYGFLLIPLLYAAYGWRAWHFPHQRVFVVGYIGSFFLLSFIMVFWQPRLSFLLFPVVYPLAALGLYAARDALAVTIGVYPARVFLYASLFLILFISNSNVYRLVPYG